MARIREKAEGILERLTAELDAIGCEYQISFGRNSEEETFGAMAYSDNFNVYRAIESLEITLAATKQMRDALEADGPKVIADGIERHRRSIQ